MNSAPRSSSIRYWSAALTVSAVLTTIGFIVDESPLRGWEVLLVLAGAFAVLALIGVATSKRKGLPALLPADVLWKLTGVALLYNCLANLNLYVTPLQAAIPVALTAGTCCLLWAVMGRWSRVFWVPFLLLGFAQGIGFMEYGTRLNSLVLAEVLEASATEAGAYLSWINLLFASIAVCAVWWLCLLPGKVLQGQPRRAMVNTGLVYCLLGLVCGLATPGQDEDTELYWPYTEGYRLYLTYNEALYNNEKTINCVTSLPSPAQEPSKLPTLKGGEGVVLVVHIGESVRADRMGINGYGRDTTPWLSSQSGKGLINFTDCISAACDTCQAQIAILTDARRDVHEQDPELVARTGSVLDLFNANGFDVYCFRGARCAEKLKYDRVVHLLTRCARQCFYAPGSPWTAVPQMGEVLREHNSGENMVFFINNEGSHTPFSHYDREDTPFLPAGDNFGIPAQHAEEVNNAYDSTIHYTDEFVRRVAQQLQGRPFVYVYVSDHGEYLGHDGIWGRGGLGASKYSYHSTTGCRVGMFVLYSPEFEKLHPHFAEALKELSAHAGMTVGHEHIFHTLLGLFGVETPHYNGDLDLCSPAAKPYDGPRPE